MALAATVRLRPRSDDTSDVLSNFDSRPQIEVLSVARAVRCRHWSDDDKLRIVEEALPATRRHPVRKPLPDHLPRELVIFEALAACTCCCWDRLVKMGEDITGTREVTETVLEKFTCRACGKLSHPPAPFYAILRGWADPA